MITNLELTKRMLRLSVMGVSMSRVRRRGNRVLAMYQRGSNGEGTSSSPEYLTASARQRSITIDRRLELEREELKKIFKILLLGMSISSVQQ